MDLLIVFVHYQYLEAAVRNALPMIDKHTMILCLQNGLGNYDEIAKVVPEEQIIIGNTAFGSTPVAPGHVKHTGTGVTNMGSLKAPMAKVEEMAEGLRAAGLEVQVHENVMNAIWHKLLANVAINGMSALLETKNGFVDGNQYAHEAARMLVETDTPVAVISREVGMENASYFSTVFRKAYGMSPSLYRETNQSATQKQQEGETKE